MAASITAAEAIRDALADAGILAVLDVREVVGNAPCVLIPPPAWDDWTADGSPSYAWRLIALSGQALGNLDAWVELDDLVTAVALVLAIDRADPIGYVMPTGGAPMPAYALTYSGS